MRNPERGLRIADFIQCPMQRAETGTAFEFTMNGDSAWDLEFEITHIPRSHEIRTIPLISEEIEDFKALASTSASQARPQDPDDPLHTDRGRSPAAATTLGRSRPGSSSTPPAKGRAADKPFNFRRKPGEYAG